ncbi:MAG: SGNH/GDSL hydrolase family protein [Lentisphaeria bacterium]|nr:SGNH/GDSL hydrolase family protein [Lentisphaeria bacterium]
MIEVANPAENVVYQRGRDWDFANGGLVRLPGSAIPELGPAELYPAPDKARVFPAKDADAVTGGPDGKLLRFDNRDFFARRQISFSYRTPIGAIPGLPKLPKGVLPRFRAKLRQGGPVKITALGDSITQGFNATAFVGCPPYQPCYAELFAAFLKRRFCSPVELRNLAVEGTCIDDAIERRESWRDDDSDLYLIAYGMNDFVCRTPEKFVALAEELVGLVPSGEFLFVSAISANPEWSCIPPGKDAAFASTLRCWCRRNNFALADVNALWHQISDRRDYWGLTGNGVNHPNDFGHRLYASVLCHLFAD